MSAAPLLTMKDMAVLLGLSLNHLQRPATRRRLEAEGCPPPIMLHPLRWSGPTVERWIGGSAAAPLASSADEKAKWRERLAAEYSEAS